MRGQSGKCPGQNRKGPRPHNLQDWFGGSGVGVNKGSDMGPGVRAPSEAPAQSKDTVTYTEGPPLIWGGTDFEQRWEPSPKTWSPEVRRAIGYRTEREEAMEAACVLMLALSRFNKPGMFPALPQLLPQHRTSNSKVILVTGRASLLPRTLDLQASLGSTHSDTVSVQHVLPGMMTTVTQSLPSTYSLG